MERLDSARILIYSHDSFGLGHLRRCRAIAHDLVERFKGLSVLILSGSPIIGSFDFRARVDFVRIPGVIKLRNGEYTSLGLHIDLSQTLAMRASIIRHTAEIFDPHLLLVDKEPLGLKGEVTGTLEAMRERGCRCVLGLRELMDAPEALAAEWERKRALPALDRLYDEIWVYGPEGFADPLQGLALPGSVPGKTFYTGYLRRGASPEAPPAAPELPAEPFLLVTPGGGGDGQELVDWVLRAYECHGGGLPPAMLVLGPFMSPALRESFQARVRRLPGLRAITFDSHPEYLMSHCAGVVAMGGYNTFCELLSFDKPALLVPRTQPRMEQFMRATRAAELGLARTLDPEHLDDAGRMARALRALASSPPPSAAALPGLLDGLDRVTDRVAMQLGAPAEDAWPAAAGLQG